MVEKGEKRPEGMGIKKGYKYKKLSNEQKLQRKDAGIQSGKYKLMEAALGKCDRCPIRDICTDWETGKVQYINTRGVKVKGCNQALEIFKFHLAGLTTSEKYLLTDIAHLQSKIDMQEMRDNVDKVVISPEWLKAKELNIKYLKLLNEVLNKRSNRIIQIPIDAGIVEFNKVDKDKEFLGEGDMYIPDPKPKKKMYEVKPDESKQPSEGDNPKGREEETGEHSSSEGDNEVTPNQTSTPT